MATFTSFATPVSAVTFTEHASSCSFTLIVGGIKSSPTALIHAIASIAPAAPNKCPVIDFVLETCTLSAASFKA